MILTPYPVILDACVLYPAQLRDLLMHLGIVGLYQPKWSSRIHEEWCRNLLQNRPELKSDALARTVSLMNKALPDANVTGYENLISGLTLPDVDDRHVVAAAIRANAGVIVTRNCRDFPASVLTPLNIDVLPPDIFIADLIDLNLMLSLEAVTRQRQSLRHPSFSAAAFLSMLRQIGLPITSKVLMKYRDVL